MMKLVLLIVMSGVVFFLIGCGVGVDTNPHERCRPLDGAEYADCMEEEEELAQ